MKISDQVVMKLQALIEERHMKKGDRLPAERQLATSLGVSRPSLREAIQQLNSQGVLSSRRGDGTYIQQLPEQWPQQLIVNPISNLIEEDPLYRFDVQEARLLLEGGTAWYAALRSTPEDRAKIHHYFNEISRHQNAGDSAQAAVADAEFHLAIAEASHNVVLIQMMRSLFDLLQYNVLLGRKKVYNDPVNGDLLSEQHFQVMDAIDRKDPEAARQAVCGHIEFVINHVRSLDEDEARQKRANRLNRVDSMIISSGNDYRAAAQRRLPPFLFHYIDGGAYAEYTLKRNVQDLSEIALRQRVLNDMSALSLETKLFNETLSMPVALAPVGLTGMYARRGEVQAAMAADKKGIPFTLSTVSVCPIEEVAPAINRPMWFQLYVLRDRGFMRNALERAKAAGCSTLVFTVDMPVPGARYRDAHSGMSGPNAAMRRYMQSMFHPHWSWNVGLMGRPHDLGNISKYLGKPTGLEDYIGWLGSNFDPSISWKDLEWIREFWDGPMVIKGILDPEDAKDAVRFGADGIVVSNHGGRQLDGVMSSARALPAIAEAVKGDLAILADSGIRNGLDVVRMLALGADTVLLGRAFVYALAAAGGQGVSNLLDLIDKEMRVAMTLTGAKSISDINADCLVQAIKQGL